MEELQSKLHVALTSAEGQALMKRAFQRMAAPPSLVEARAAGARGWHMGACLILAEGLRIWLQDEEAVLYGCGEWTEAAEREGHPGKFHHEGYWDYVDHVLLASGEYLLDGGGVYPREDAEGVARWWSEEFHPGYGVRPLADLSVSLEEEGIWDAPSVSLALAKLLEKEVGSGEVWREKLKDGLGLV